MKGRPTAFFYVTLASLTKHWQPRRRMRRPPQASVVSALLKFLVRPKYLGLAMLQFLTSLCLCYRMGMTEAPAVQAPSRICVCSVD
jgi:hypothetical protein